MVRTFFVVKSINFVMSFFFFPKLGLVSHVNVIVFGSVCSAFLQNAPVARIAFDKLGGHLKSRIEDSSSGGSSDWLHGNVISNRFS